MRLLKIGRDASCNIVLHSDKVSSLHAEITVLNNGDILLEDKGSRNGTFLMNKPIKSGTSISVRRGDAIRFADVELMWSQVPMQEDNSNFKALYGIGSNFRNEIQITGNTASRFHATLKIGKDGKTYIQDHSKNGTTVNGIKITFGQNVKIKRSDAIACGGVPVDLKQYIPGSKVLTKLIGVVAIAAVLAGVVFGVKYLLNSEKPSIKTLENATACVFSQYYIEVTFKDDPFVGLIEDWPKKWIFGLPENAKEHTLVLGTMMKQEIIPIGNTGTAFFISKNGELGTNRHIALPWEYLSTKDTESIKQQMENAISDVNPILINILNKAIKHNVISSKDAISYYNRLQKSPLEISGRFEYLGIALTGSQISTPADLLTCQMIAESNDKDKDVALLRLNSKTTPEKIVKDGFFDITIARTDESTLVPQEETLTTMGYPAGFTIGFATAKSKELMPTVHKAYISKTPDENGFQFQGQSIGGQSGSPIIDEDRNLIGVLYGGYTQTEFSYGCNIKHLVELYNKHKVVQK